MNGSKAGILARIRKGLNRPTPGSEDVEQAYRQLGDAPKPSHSADLLTRFEQQAEAAKARVSHIDTLSQLPQLLIDDGPLVLNPEVLAMPIDWHAAGVHIETEVPYRDGATVVTSALAGIAETGTVAVSSAPDHGHAWHLLGRTHVVLLPCNRLLPDYEAFWQHMRDRGTLPRIVCWITGPSLTGDIEQTLQLGAHGPKQLHIVLIDRV